MVGARRFGPSKDTLPATDVVDEIDLGHVNGFTLAKRSLEAVEPETHGIRAFYKLLKCVCKTLTVVGMNGSDDDRAPILQSFCNLVFTWFHNQPMFTKQSLAP